MMGRFETPSDRDEVCHSREKMTKQFQLSLARLDSRSRWRDKRVNGIREAKLKSFEGSSNMTKRKAAASRQTAIFTPTTRPLGALLFTLPLLRATSSQAQTTILLS